MRPTDDQAVEFLTEMVRTPSLCGSEDAVAEVMCGAMEKFGFEAVGRDAAGNARGCVGPADAARSVMVLGHMDTVPGEIPVETRDGCLYGRGSVDAKGPLATAVVAAARAAGTTSARVTVVGAVQEEGTSAGARHLAEKPAPAMLVIAEPSGWDAIVLGYKGSQRFTASITVQKSHSAAPEPTAAELAFDLWSEIRAWCGQHAPPSEKETQVFQQLSPTLLSTDWEEDGLHETASLYVGLRLPPGVDPECVRQGVPKLAPHAEFSFNSGEPAVRSDRRTPLASRFARGIRDEGGTPRYKVKTGTSDMNVVLPVWKCQTVAYGPGDSHLDHTPQEHLQLDEYLSAVRVLTRVLGEP
jgi:[amino group carrier protein]-lysine/ornithine hydrolase